MPRTTRKQPEEQEPAETFEPTEFATDDSVAAEWPAEPAQPVSEAEPAAATDVPTTASADAPVEAAESETPAEVPEAESTLAPPAHSVSSRPTPTPPAWSYRAAGAPVGAAMPAGPELEAPLTALGSEPTVRPGAASLGPVGKRRSSLAVIALSVITLGVYTLIWHARINGEVGNFDPQMHVRPGRSALAVGVSWLVGVLMSVAGAARIVFDQLHVSLPFDPHFSVTQAYYLLGGIVVIPYLELLVSFSAVAIVMTLERLRIAEERVGRTTDVQLRPTSAVWWLVVPVVGGLVLLAKMQRRANQVWELAAPARISRY